MHLKEILIKSSQLRQLQEFYQSILELEVSSESDSRITITFGESVLIIEETESGNPFYHFAINIPANKIDEARAWLLKKKIELLWMEDYKSDIADFRGWHAKSVYFFDPAGNIVELIARFDLKNETDESFSSNQFLSISEMGLVFPQDEIDEQVGRIIKETRLSYFLKQPPMPQFKVLGDDEGLLIIVTENRNWYPTNKPSGIFPLEVTLDNDGKSGLLRY
jgi:hypothetical protein